MSLALLAAQVGSAWCAEDFAVEVERQGRLFAVRARATVAAPLPVAWEVLTDYEKLPRFIPGITKSEVRLRSGNRLLVEQQGEARFLLFSFPIEVRYEVLESPPHRIASRAVGGNLRRMSGRYELHSDSPDAGMQLQYTGEMEPDFDLPPLAGAFALRRMAEAQFTAMVAEIERRAAARR